MIIRQIFRSIEKSDTKCAKYNLVSRYFCIDLNEGPAKRQERKLKKWQKDEDDDRPMSFLAMFDRTQVPTEGNVKKALRDTSFGDPLRGEKPDISIAGLRAAMHRMNKFAEVENQKYIPDRLNILGCDLGVAHFVLFREGKVKFRHEDKWLQAVNNVVPEIPKVFDPKYIVSAIDCSNMKLYYEGLLNFENLTRAKWASFRGNPVFDEWCLDRIVGQMPCLEYLDVSSCPKLNERGLEALYKLFYLKTLIVTNYEKSASFELTCLMLEDCNPKLKCVFVEPGEIYEEKSEAESKSETDSES